MAHGKLRGVVFFTGIMIYPPVRTTPRLRRINPFPPCVPYCALAVAWFAFADTPRPTFAAELMDEVLVTAPEKSILTAPLSASIIKADEFIGTRNVRTLADALDRTPGIMIQRTAYGQASPFIRGFTGFRTLTLIDGIRLNNAVFREGPNQYFSTIDSLSVDRIDVLKGPSATTLGSDAIGGAINVVTRNPQTRSERLNQGLANPIGGDAYYRFSSAENSHSERISINLAPSEKLAFLAGFARRDFGDLRGGRDTGLLTNTGYEEWSGDSKVLFTPDKENRFTLALSTVRQDAVPRTHATVFAVPYGGSTIGSDQRRNLNQERTLAYIRWESDAPPLNLDSATASVSIHRQGEQQDRISSKLVRDFTGFRDTQIGLQLSAKKASAIGEIRFGSDWYHDEVSSWGKRWRADGSFEKTLPRGSVANQGSQDQLGAFVEDDIPLTHGFFATLGSRLSWNRIRATGVDPDLSDNQLYPDVSQSWSALTNSARLRWEATSKWTLFSGVSQGYRTPNLSDLTSFDIVRSGEREIPRTDLQPEKFLTLEIGSKFQSAEGTANLQCAVFHTVIEDQIIRNPTGTFDTDGKTPLVTRKNGGQGYIQGIELQGDLKLTRSLSLFGNACWTEGYIDAFLDSSPSSLSRQPASRIQPLSGILGLRWQSPSQRWWAETTAQLARHQDRLSPGDQQDTQRIPPGGTKGYQVYGIRAGWRPSRALDVTVGVENVTNLDYRILGSGINEAGTNLTVAVRLRF